MKKSIKAQLYTRVGTFLILSSLASCNTTLSPESQVGTSSRLLQKSTTRPIAIEKAIVKMVGSDWEDKKPFSINLANAVDELDIGGSYELPNNTEYSWKRNEVQDYLIAVSNQNCGKFKRRSLSTQSNINFGLGGIAAVFATAGGLVNPESTAKAFSASSAALLGLQSSYSENFYREKAFEIITRAINVRRKIIIGDIQERRQEKGYTISRAIADAVNYNNACSLIEGLEELNISISEQDDAAEKAVTEAAENDDKNKASIRSLMNK